MTSVSLAARAAVLLAVLLMLAGCGNRSTWEPPELQGRPAMVASDGKPQLLALIKQEESRTTTVGGGRRTSFSTRTDTFFHFFVQAYDPVAAKPLWKVRLQTFGDPDARGPQPSRVVGSSVSGRLLGQEGDVVWLMIGDVPYAISAKDGKLLADVETLQERNPALRGLMPSEARLYGFDRGLAFTAADARPFVIRGPKFAAEDYVPTPAPPPEEGPMQANGQRRMVPMRPFLEEAPQRQVLLGGELLGLYSPEEAKDAGNDEWGDHRLWPYSVTDEGAEARRTFWRIPVENAQRFDDRFERLGTLTPIDGSPTFLKGRFVKKLPTEEALVLDGPPGVLVWHSTRIDAAGRLALARLDASLKPVWTTKLPISETSILNPVMFWLIDGYVVVMGEEHSQDSTMVHSRVPRLVSIDLADGKLAGWDMSAEEALAATP